MMTLTSTRVLVAGGATGIGAATAARLASHGCAVVIGDIAVDRAEDTAGRIAGEHGTQVEVVEFDAADPASVAAGVRAAEEKLGGLTGLHYNIADTSVATFSRDTNVVDMDPAIWERVLTVDLTGFFHTLRHAVPLLLRNPSAAIVATSSDCGYVGREDLVGYGVAKAGINILVQHVAVRWGRQGLRCNAIAPSFTETEAAAKDTREGWRDSVLAQLPSTRLGRPEDTAAMVAYLMSDDAEWINGQVIGVNGGLHMR